MKSDMPNSSRPSRFVRTLRDFPASARAMCMRFLYRSDGSVAVPFAASLLGLLLFIGVAIDSGGAYSAKTKIDAIIDSASLAGVSTARLALLDGGSSGGDRERALASAKERASNFFDAQMAALAGIDGEATVSVTFDNGQITSSVTYSAIYRPHLLPLFGFNEMTINGTSVASAAILPFMEITLLIDTSGSMAIGADAHEQTLLKNQIGCAFACHDNTPVKGYGDSYLYAKAMGITLRYDAINTGIKKMIDEFDVLDADAKSIQASIWSFDTYYNRKQSMTASRSQLRWNLPSAPAMSGKTEGATKFNEGIGTVLSAIGQGGSGATAASPMKLVILATDGVQDPGRFWVDQPAYRADVAPFKMSFCETLKSRNIRVGVLHTPYIPMSDDWGYMATLGQPSQLGNPGTRADDVARVLKGCAGDLYFEADSSDKISEGFVNILRSANTPRLVM